MNHRPAWIQTEIPSEGSFLERMDSVIHFSPESQRWYLREPERWVKVAEIEVERFFSFAWWQGRKKVSTELSQDEVCLWKKEMQDLKNLCCDRVETNHPYR